MGLLGAALTLRMLITDTPVVEKSRYLLENTNKGTGQLLLTSQAP